MHLPLPHSCLEHPATHGPNRHLQGVHFNTKTGIQLSRIGQVFRHAWENRGSTKYCILEIGSLLILVDSMQGFFWLLTLALVAKR